jgi:hypothetical protein
MFFAALSLDCQALIIPIIQRPYDVMTPEPQNIAVLFLKRSLEGNPYRKNPMVVDNHNQNPITLSSAQFSFVICFPSL